MGPNRLARALADGERAPSSKDVDLWVVPEDRGEIVPHPHDVLVSKLPRLSPSDREHIELILAQMPLERARLDELANASPARSGEASE